MMLQKMSQKGLGLPARPARAATVRVRATADRKGQTALLAAAAVATLQAAPVRAEPVAAAGVQAEPNVDSAVDTVIGAVKATGEFVKAGINVAGQGVQVLREGYNVAAPYVKSAVKTATPVVEQAIKATGDVAGPVVKAALPTLQDGVRALETTGANNKAVSEATNVVSQATSTAVTTVSPFVGRFIQFLANNDAVTIGEYALGAVALVYFGPSLLGLLGGSFRGYAGDLAAAAALDALANDGNSVLIDIRTSKEKEGSGVPDLPSSAGSKALEVEYAITEDKRLRNQLRDPSSIEAQVTALQIAALKKIGKGTKVVLLDRYGPAARTVAKELSRKGYGKVYVISGGFDGRGGWVQSKLQIKPAANIMSSTPPSLAKTVFTRSRGALPAPKSS